MSSNLFFDDQVGNSEVLSRLNNDIAIRMMSNNLEFKINEANSDISKAISQLYNPTERHSLLAYLAYKVGHFKFKTPLVLSAEITNSSDGLVTVASGTRFSDGASVYLLNSTVSLPDGVATQATFTNAVRFIVQHTVKDSLRYFKIKTDANYDDISEIIVKVATNTGSTTLINSQLFIANDGEVSFEIGLDGSVDVIVLLGNKYANNISTGDILTVETLVSTNDALAPDTLGVVDAGYNMVVSNISVKSLFVAAMSNEYMSNVIRFGRNYSGNHVMNENYRSLIIENINGISHIKVWQEREESRENGYDVTMINRVYVSFITDSLSSSVEIENRITAMFRELVYGKYVVFVPSVIIAVAVDATITTDSGVSDELKSLLRSDIAGYYDGVNNLFKESVVYNAMFKRLIENIAGFSLEVSITDASAYQNAFFYFLSDDDVDISIVATGY